MPLVAGTHEVDTNFWTVFSHPFVLWIVVEWIQDNRCVTNWPDGFIDGLRHPQLYKWRRALRLLGLPLLQLLQSPWLQLEGVERKVHLVHPGIWSSAGLHRSSQALLKPPRAWFARRFKDLLSEDETCRNNAERSRRAVRTHNPVALFVALFAILNRVDLMYTSFSNVNSSW